MSTLLENLIGYLSPEAAFRRAQYRRANKILEGERKYEAASVTRRTDGWTSTSTSANSEIGNALHRLRARSRDLVRNNGYAFRAVRAISRNVVGKGVKPAPVLEEQNEELAKLIKREWKKFAGKKAVDFHGKKNFYQIQKQVVAAVAESGECLVVRRRVRVKDLTEMPFKLQVLEADHIDSSKNNYSLKGGEDYDVQGVRLDKFGRVVGYWLFEDHPSETMRRGLTSKLYKREDVLHIYEELRAGQVRGVPFGVSAMVRLRDLDEYEDAQLIRQKIAACFTAFVTDPQGTSVVSDPSSDNEANIDRLEPGLIETLPVGKDVKLVAPPTVENYGEYTTKILQGISVAYEVPYELLTGDLSNVNFSSGRMGWLEFQRRVADLQDDLVIPQLCEPVWDWFMDALDLRGVLSDYYEANWTPPKREMIQPKEELAAAKDMVRNGFSTWSEQVRGFGFEPDEVLAGLKEERDKFEAAELMLDVLPEHDANRNADKTSESNLEEKKEKP